jgi:FkbM family methyltransferase
MVTIKGLVRTLAVSPQPLNCLPYQNRKTVSLRNGWKFNITFPQFREIRDSYAAIKKFELKQLGDDLFEADYGSFKITDNLRMVCTYAEMMHRYELTKLGDNSFRMKGDNFTLEGSSLMLFIWRELISDAYKADYKNKTVLDIGGYQGETAVYYWISGAKKVVIYEPFLKNYELIRKNMQLNGVNAEVHNAGIGEKDGNIKLPVFGENESKEESIAIKNITSVIEESGADMAKIDCEGAEASLTTVPDEILRKIPSYMLEIHSQQIEKDLIAKFTGAGFKVVKLRKMSSDISIALFER